MGWDKVRFKVFTRLYNFTFFIHPASFTLVRYDKVLEIKEVKWIQDNWSIFEKSITQKNCHTAVCDMMKKLYSLLLILTPIKKVHAFQKFMPMLITFVAINYEEMLKKDFALKYFLEVNVVVIRTNPPSIINNMLPSLFLELVIVYPWKCWNRWKLQRSS